MEMGKLAAVTAADLYVIAALTTLALAMWLARRFVGWLLKLLPIALALLSTGGAVAMWLAGAAMGWDSPGSPGILIVVGALIVSAFVAIAAWTAVVFQIRRWRRPEPPSSPSAKHTLNAVQVVCAIAFVVWALGSMYLSYRAHQPSHDAAVTQLAFSHDGESLYSLDAAGVLKRWSTRYFFEAKAWNVPVEGVPSEMLVSGDGVTLVTLHDGLLESFDLAHKAPAAEAPAAPRAVTRSAAVPDVVAIAPVDGENLAVVRADTVTLRPYADLAAVIAASAPPAPALSAAAYPDGQVVVGLEDRTLRAYRVADGTLRERELTLPASLEVLPRELRVDRTGRFVVVADGEKHMVVLDLQHMRQDALPEYYLPSTFDISGGGELLLGQVGITGYDLAERRTEPLFNHGGTIAALAVSPRADLVAIGDRKAIYLVADSTYYGAPYQWLNGSVDVERLSSVARRVLHR
jgi:hypothetical protein